MIAILEEFSYKPVLSLRVAHVHTRLDHRYNISRLSKYLDAQFIQVDPPPFESIVPSPN